MKQGIKKAVAVLLSAAMCFGMVAQAAPGGSGSTDGQTEKEAVSVQETETDGTEECTQGPEAGEKETDPSSGPGDYRITLPAREGVSYQVDEPHKAEGLSTAGQEVMLYKAGEDVAFAVEGAQGFQIRKTDGSLFMDADAVKEGKVEFTMPASDLELVFREDGEETEPASEAAAGQAEETTKEPETEDKAKEAAEEPVAEKDQARPAEGKETGTGPDAEKAEPGEKPELAFKIKGDAYANIYYGISAFKEAAAHKGIHKTFTDSYTVDLEDVENGKIWVYAQSTGDYGYSGVSLPGNVKKTLLGSMPGMGGYVFYQFDVSGCGEDGGTVEFKFSGSGAAAPRAVPRAADAFNTSTRKKLTGVTYDYVKGTYGLPSMYVPRPATGEGSVLNYWGNGVWAIKRPSLDTLFNLFGVTKPGNARYTEVGGPDDDSNYFFMRCTGITDYADHTGLGSTDAYIQCIDIDGSDGNVYYTFRVWGAAANRGQTTEGYFQVVVEDNQKPTKIRLKKSLRSGTVVTDLLGNRRAINMAGARFRLYKLNSAGISQIEKKYNKTGKSADEWWASHDGRASKKEILGYVESLILADCAKPGDAETGKLNPNQAYFNVAASYATGSGGKTEAIPVDTGVKDYYIAFERYVPYGMNYGYQGNDGVPEGKHYFYKVFSVYGEDNNIIMIDGEGGSENNTDNNLVSFEDDPLLVDIKIGKSTPPELPPESKGLTWGDFEFLVSDNAGFSGKVATIKLTGPETAIHNFLVGNKYYIKENPDSPACRSDVGYVADDTVFSFMPEEDGKVTYSDTHPGELDSLEAVDAYPHDKIGLKGNPIFNPSKTASVKLIKASSVPDITINNKCYSLAGATYEIYQKTSPTADNTGGILRGTLVTDETGASNVLQDIPTGYYYAKETAAPKGFKKNETPKAFTVVSGVDVNTVEVKDEPLDDPIGVLLQKKDTETNEDSPQGGAALEGAEYTVNYYDGYYDTSEELEGLTPFRSWVFKTDSNGKISLRTNTPISGGNLYCNDKGEPVFPLGTVAIKETKEPDGYKIDPTVYVYKIEQDSSGMNVLKAWNTAEIPEEPERGDFKFYKSSDDGTPLADVPFKITSNTTGESHIIVTDEDGLIDTSKQHSKNTNRGETSEDGIWFGDTSALDDSKGALLYDTYTVTEVLCEGNKDKFLVEPFEVTIDGEEETKDLGIIGNETKEEPKLRTTATDTESQAHDAFVNETTTITDVVEYANLEVGKEYTFAGYLVLKETGEPLLDAEGNRVTASTKLTVPETAEDFKPTAEGSDDARYGKGTVELTFTFDSSLLKGKQAVVFEDLYLEGLHVAAHADINDEGQTINFKDPKVSTTATDKDTGRHYAPLEKEVTITDEVAYKDLIPGHTYKLDGILMDKATGEPLLVDGGQVTAEKEFTPEGAEGTVTLEYTLDSTALEDVSTVVFETLSYKGREIAAHADITDENQEVYFTGTKIGTTATDNETGLHDGIVGAETTITDKVQYTGIIPGREYTVSGYLVFKDTGKAVADAAGNKVESSVTFTPAERDGSVDIIFTFDSSLLDGKPTVAFETVYQGKREVGVHADINDDDQTVTFHKPEIGTMAMEKELGGHKAFVSEKTEITDTVHYKNLVPGITYTVSGILMDKDTGKPLKAGGKKVVSETSFTPETAEGDVEVTFTLDSSRLAGKTTVAFETLYIGKREIASHTEIGDKKQAVSFQDVKLGTKARDKESGTQETKADKKVSVIDTVSYSGLVAGKKYTVSGVLMDKATGKPLKVGGKKVTAQKTFTAGKAKGSIELTFTFDSSALAGKTLVVFESLIYGGREIASHADLEDKAQAVTVKKPEGKDGAPTAKSPKTGESARALPYVVAGLIAAAILLDYLMRRRKIK